MAYNLPNTQFTQYANSNDILQNTSDSLARTPVAPTDTPNFVPYQNEQQKAQSLARMKTPDGKTPFFDPNNSWMGNMGQGMNLIGSGVSLYGMLQSIGQSRENHSLNKDNIESQMERAQGAYDADVKRYNDSLAAVKARNERSQQNA